MGLPCISGFPDLLTIVLRGVLALVDADTGMVTINPREKEKVIFREMNRPGFTGGSIT
jgi:hypothetical protein